ncbi:MAG: DnaA/Hda family protein [Planctomycetia bacterium]|nr:DnaA/Hda family protein [Planctomycetia bacterium]
MSNRDSNIAATILQRVQEHLDEETFALWFEGKITLKYQKQILKIETNNPYILDWHQKKYQSLMRKAAEDVLGFTPELSYFAKKSRKKTPEGELMLPGFSEAILESRAISAAKGLNKPKRSKKVAAPRRSSAKKEEPSPSLVVSEIEEKVEAPLEPWHAFTQQMELAIQSPTVRKGGRSTGTGRSTPRRPYRHSAAVAEGESRVHLPRKIARDLVEVGERHPGHRYGTLETFVEGTSNHTAYTTACSLLRQPGMISPVVFYGDSGVGKTHLLDAVWKKASDAGKRVQYCTAEEFTTDFLEMLRSQNRSQTAFRKQYREADFFILDDLQFLLKKPSTLAELLHIIAHMQRTGRQILMACDRPLDSMLGLGKDLLSYLKGGVWCKINPPAFDVRTRIITQLAERKELKLSAEQRKNIATQFTGDVRELIGAINTLKLMSQTQSTVHPVKSTDRYASDLSMNAQFVEEVISQMASSSLRSVQLDEIKRVVCEMFGIAVEDLSSGGRSRRITQPRMLAMWLARKYTRKPFAEIGHSFGCASHSTVISAQKKVETWLEQGMTLQTSQKTLHTEEILRRMESQLRQCCS